MKPPKTAGMRNEELRLRMQAMGVIIPKRAKQLAKAEPVARELELINMNLMQIGWLMGEIALRLPEPEPEPEPEADP